jgi:hypothetical protein
VLRLKVTDLGPNDAGGTGLGERLDLVGRGLAKAVAGGQHPPKSSQGNVSGNAFPGRMPAC